MIHTSRVRVYGKGSEGMLLITVHSVFIKTLGNSSPALLTLVHNICKQYTKWMWWRSCRQILYPSGVLYGTWCDILVGISCHGGWKVCLSLIII